MSFLFPPAASALPPQLCLDVEGLAAPIGTLRPGRIYGLAADSDSCLAMLWPALLAAARSSPVALATAQRPESLLGQARGDWPEVEEAVKAGAIRVLRYEPLGSPEQDAERMRRELAGLGLRTDALLVLHGLPFPADEPQACLAAWRRWAGEQRHALLLVFAGADGSIPGGELLPAAEEFAGLAAFRDHGRTAELTVFHWFGAHGVASGQRFSLARAGGRRFAVQAPAAAGGGLPAAPDDGAVYALAEALSGHAAPPGWRVFDTLEALVNYAEGAVAATCVLAFDPRLPAAELFKSVFRLRCSGGQRLKIVIRESGARLRYSQESLLLRLGANLVVPAEVGNSRFLGMLEMVQGQLFSRFLPASYEEAVASAVPIPAQGYLPPSAFASAIREALERGAGLGVQCALVRFSLVPGLSPLDALRHCTVRRGGDICSAGHETVYVFLFACREPDVAPALDRIFRLPVGELFADEIHYLSRGTILGALQAFSAAADHHPAPDLGPALAAAPEPSAPAAAGSDAPRREAPPAALRRPLALRQPAPAAAEDIAA